jgi:hypothetical protein
VSEPNPRDQPRRLGPLGKGLIGVGVVLAVGLVAVTVLVVPGQIERRRTERLLLELVRLGGGAATWGPHSGRTQLVFKGDEGSIALTNVGEFGPEHTWGEGWPVDPWARPIRYCAPGPVHKHGWDLWSCGPNGIDENGQGDDILIGEDVADVTTR